MSVLEEGVERNQRAVSLVLCSMQGIGCGHVLDHKKAGFL